MVMWLRTCDPANKRQRQERKTTIKKERGVGRLCCNMTKLPHRVVGVGQDGLVVQKDELNRRPQTSVPTC